MYHVDTYLFGNLILRMSLIGFQKLCGLETQNKLVLSFQLGHNLFALNLKITKILYT